MAKKRLTERFPCLIPLRIRQRKFCFYLGMRFDGRKYAKTQNNQLLPYETFASSCPLYNSTTGFDMIYQENKVYNLKLAAAQINGLLLRPGETFSFCKSTRHADRNMPYKDGLTVINGELTTSPGGGLCQISNLLFWIFLHSPLTITERHGHKTKDFPEPPSDAPMGVDATISEGWLDLKATNNTTQTFQLSVTFNDDSITGRLLTDYNNENFYIIENKNLQYFQKNNVIFEEVDIIQKLLSKETGEKLSEKKLYRNKCRIGYPLPEGTPIIIKGA
ncbi:MAG: glycopeptide resistance accessory protein VanW [Clostridiales bacterium]|nr:glycopeptide resistance accessory protein VanW [Clostridiales bacterium]